MSARIFYTKPSITELEGQYAADAATNGWGGSCNDYINRFESAFKKHLGVQYAIATSSCTGALHMGLAALGVGRGDEVILADTNWIATASPIVHLGAKPVFVDSRPCKIHLTHSTLNPGRVTVAGQDFSRAISRISAARTFTKSGRNKRALRPRRTIALINQRML